MVQSWVSKPGRGHTVESGSSANSAGAHRPVSKPVRGPSLEQASPGNGVGVTGEGNDPGGSKRPTWSLRARRKSPAVLVSKPESGASLQKSGRGTRPVDRPRKRGRESQEATGVNARCQSRAARPTVPCELGSGPRAGVKPGTGAEPRGSQHRRRAAGTGGAISTPAVPMGPSWSHWSRAKAHGLVSKASTGVWPLNRAGPR